MHPTISKLKNHYKIEISDHVPDPDWDAFLASTPGGSHFQTSRWAEVKQKPGWRVFRVKASMDGKIIGGAQMLLRRIPLIGSIAFISRGPVISTAHSNVSSHIVSSLCKQAQQHRIHYLLVQPPRGADWIVDVLKGRGFLQSIVSVVPTTVVQIDLTISEDALFKQVTPRVRRYIRSAKRKGINIREGNEADLPTFLALLKTTASEKGWSIFDDEYYRKMWKTLHPSNNVRLTLASQGEETIASMLVYVHGESAYGKTLVRTGHHNNSGAHELLLWESMRWAKTYGCRIFDLSRIDPKTGDKYMNKLLTLKEISGDPAFSKLKFGGQVFHGPKAYAYLYHPILRAVYQLTFQTIQNMSALRKLIRSVRGLQKISSSDSRLE